MAGKNYGGCQPKKSYSGAALDDLKRAWALADKQRATLDDIREIVNELLPLLASASENLQRILSRLER